MVWHMVLTQGCPCVVRCHQSHPGTWCQGGNGRVWRSGLAPQLYPAQPWRALQHHSCYKDAARSCLGTQEEFIVSKPASRFLSGSSRARSTLQLENVPAELLLDQCPHKLIQQLSFWVGFLVQPELESLPSLSALFSAENEAHCKVKVFLERIFCSKKRIPEMLQTFLFPLLK